MRVRRRIPSRRQCGWSSKSGQVKARAEAVGAANLQQHLDLVKSKQEFMTRLLEVVCLICKKSNRAPMMAVDIALLCLKSKTFTCHLRMQKARDLMLINVSGLLTSQTHEGSSGVARGLAAQAYRQSESYRPSECWFEPNCSDSQG